MVHIGQRITHGQGGILILPPMPFRPMKVLALAWLLVAVGVAVLIGPRLGWRGWIWLGAHEALCLVGAGWELWSPWLAPLAERLERPFVSRGSGV